MILAGVYGLLIGSFLNVVIARVPEGRSVLRPRSACPSCETPIAGRDNVPVVSWLLLRGRCRSCSEPISARYPIVELATAAVLALTAAVLGAVAHLPAYLVVTAGLVAVTGIDLDTYRIPTPLLRWIMILGAPLLVVAALVRGEPGRLLSAGIGAVAAFAVLFAIHAVVPAGMGFGDVRLAFVLGTFTGWLGGWYVPLALLLGFGLGSVVGVVLMASGRAGRRSRIPFGPFLAAGAWIAICWGAPILEWYGVPR